jgi:hypothetical protein
MDTAIKIANPNTQKLTMQLPSEIRPQHEKSAGVTGHLPSLNCNSERIPCPDFIGTAGSFNFWSVSLPTAG